MSLLLCLPFLLNALSPFGGQHAAAFALVLLVLVVATLALGDARRLRGQAIAERDQSRRAVTAAQRDQPPWPSAPASPVNCTTSSPTTSP